MLHLLFVLYNYHYDNIIDIQMKQLWNAGDPWVGFDQLCWHNFRIIGTNFGGISIEHNAI